MTDPAVIKESIKLSEVIGQSVQLRRSSSADRFIGLCPFHNERNPSFCVDDSWGRYKCFSCGVSGDVMQYLQDSEGIDFKAAIKIVKGLAGIEDEYLTPSDRRVREASIKSLAAERKNLRAWKTELRNNLICYTSLEWEIHRKAKRQLLETWTQELEDQSEIAFAEADKKERALDEFEAMQDNELLGFYRSRKSWEGVANPKWFLSGKRLELVRSNKV